MMTGGRQYVCVCVLVTEETFNSEQGFDNLRFHLLSYMKVKTAFHTMSILGTLGIWHTTYLHLF